VIVLDTSVLVDALTGPRRSGVALVEVVRRGERLGLSSLVLYEWLRGPRRDAEVADQEALLPAAAALAFGASEALIAARLYRALPRARDRERDLAIAAVAMAHEASLWTLNRADFADIPGLELYDPLGPGASPGPPCC
jgi:predicted nucleic acid-binding protein